MDKFMNCNVGDLVEFRYFGGSVYGQTRQIKVTKYDYPYSELGGIDVLDENKYKNFSTNKIRGDFKVISASKPMEEELKDLQVLFSKHPAWITKMLPDFNSRHKVDYIWDKDNEVLRLPTILCKAEIHPENYLITIESPSHKQLRFYIDYDGTIGMLSNGKNIYNSARRTAFKQLFK